MPNLISSTRAAVARRLVDATGGPGRLRVVAILAAVLALDSADKATVGAAAPSLESSIGIGDAQVGLLVTVSTAVAAIATLPAGVLVDRVNRVRLLTAALVVWSIALAAGGLAGSWPTLMASRLALGAVGAVAGPATASLVGDYFRRGERGRIYGFILAGELLGSGIGFLASGNVAALLSWREAFWMVAALGPLLSLLVARWLSEPERGGEGLPLQVGSSAHRALAIYEEESPGATAADPLRAAEPAPITLPQAIGRILRVRTNRSLIVASALGYFYFTGLRTFAVSFVHRQYGIPNSAASTLLVVLGVGAIAGTVTSGRLGDRLLTRGHRAARPALAGVAYVVCAVVFGLGLVLGRSSLLVAAPFVFVGAAALGGANPPLDAARLDVMEPMLWGRAESARTVFRSLLEAPAPVLFGMVATALSASPRGTATGEGLADAFLVMMIGPVVAGLLLLRATRTYPRDVDRVAAADRDPLP